jgi:hypothetical protein
VSVVSDERRARLSSLFEVIYASSPRGSGALHFGDEELGGIVLFDMGRVCWAAVRGAGRRLTDLVCDVAGVSRQLVQDTYAECRASGARVGEVLVERKVVSAEQLRALLLQQTAESLVTLADTDDDPTWIPHRAGGYQPRFTFSVPEVVASATSYALGVDPVVARSELSEIVEGYGVGAAFDLVNEPLPFAVSAQVDDYEELRALGQWISHVVRRWPHDTPRFAIAETGAGGVAAWYAHGITFGAQFSKSAGLARLLAHLMRRA